MVCQTQPEGRREVKSSSVFFDVSKDAWEIYNLSFYWILEVAAFAMNTVCRLASLSVMIINLDIHILKSHHHSLSCAHQICFNKVQYAIQWNMSASDLTARISALLIVQMLLTWRQHSEVRGKPTFGWMRHQTSLWGFELRACSENLDSFSQPNLHIGKQAHLFCLSRSFRSFIGSFYKEIMEALIGPEFFYGTRFCSECTRVHPVISISLEISRNLLVHALIHPYSKTTRIWIAISKSLPLNCGTETFCLDSRMCKRSVIIDVISYNNGISPDEESKYVPPIRKSCSECHPVGTKRCVPVDEGFKCVCKEGWTVSSFCYSKMQLQMYQCFEKSLKNLKASLLKTLLAVT